MSFEYNKDHNDRDEILGIECDNYSGGIVHFSKLSVDNLKKLIEKHHADPDEQQNESPTIGEILSFMESYPEFTAHGYAVSPTRSDYRISIEGIQLDRKPTLDEMVEFTALFRQADEFQCDEEACYCWYD